MRSDASIRIAAWIIITLAVTACGGGSDGSASNDSAPNTSVTPISVSGGGVKGPLIGALVTAYRIDTSQSDFKGEVFDVGSTNNRAEIIDLNLEAGKFYILEIVADADTLDLTTGSAPVLKKLTTVMSPAILDSGCNHPLKSAHA